MGLASLKHSWHHVTHKHLFAAKDGQQIVWCGWRLRQTGDVLWNSGRTGADWISVDEGQLEYVLKNGTLEGYKEGEG